MNIDFSIINNIDIIIKKRVILYGYGEFGKIIHENLNDIDKEPLCICVTDLKHNTNSSSNTSLLAVSQVKEKYDLPDILIIICSYVYFQQMENEIKKLDFQQADYCTIYAFHTSLNMHYMKFNKGVSDKIRYQLKISEKRFEYYNKMYIWDEAVRASQRKEPILIFQPGKVGSRSIWRNISDRSVHFHSLVMPYGFKEIDRKMVDDNIQQLLSKNKIKIITAIREPIARDLSAIFQNSDNGRWPFSAMNDHVFWWYGDYGNNDNLIIDENSILEKDIRWEHSLNYTYHKLMDIVVKYKMDEFSWFDYEIKKVFGIDVYEYPFDQEAGYTIIRRNNIELLVLKLEKLNQLEVVIADFLEEDHYKLSNINTGREKIYQHAYDGLKQTATIPKHYFEYYYNNNKYFNHFYSDLERRKFISKWKSHMEI